MLKFNLMLELKINILFEIICKYQCLVSICSCVFVKNYLDWEKSQNLGIKIQQTTSTYIYEHILSILDLLFLISQGIWLGKF